MPFKRELLGKGVKVDFENIKVNAPENYDEYFEYQKTFRKNNERVAPIVKEFELFNNSNNKQ